MSNNGAGGVFAVLISVLVLGYIAAMILMVLLVYRRCLFPRLQRLHQQMKLLKNPSRLKNASPDNMPYGDNFHL